LEELPDASRWDPTPEETAELRERLLRAGRGTRGRRTVSGVADNNDQWEAASREPCTGRGEEQARPSDGPGDGYLGTSLMRLAKYLAHAGVASRRAAEALIAEGRVSVGWRAGA